MKNQGTKFDIGKLRMDLLPIEAINGMARAFTYGASKYGDRNWEKGIAYSRLYAALLRHLFLWWGGNEVDSESKLYPLDHALANLAMLRSMIIERGDLDDRPKRKAS